MDLVDYIRESAFIDTLTVELGGPRGWAAVAPFVFALTAVIAVGVWSSRERISRSDGAVAVAAVAGWGVGPRSPVPRCERGRIARP